MNKKGFTLIELLAVIVLLAVISGIATYGVISFINTSKLKSEKVFVEKISNLIDDYLDLYSSELSETTNTYEFKKCKVSQCTEYNENNSYTATAIKLTSINLKTLVDKGIISESDLVNPKNKEHCLSGNGPEIVIYKDSDYVYHYYANLSGTNTTCDITTENGIINNLPENLESQVNLS